MEQDSSSKRTRDQEQDGSPGPSRSSAKRARKTHNAASGPGDNVKSKKKRARWEARVEESRKDTSRDAAVTNTEQGNAEKKPRLPKKPYALLIGFAGTGYGGMQIQHGRLKTIEGTLFEALVKIGAVSEDNADDPTKVNMLRAARTDAGVHSAGNVVSMKLITAIPGVEDFVARVNEELPPEIRLWGCVRTQNSFNARTACDSRMYTYFFPTYVLIPPRPGSALWEMLARLQGTGGSAAGSSNAVQPEILKHPFWEEKDEGDEELLRKRRWRVPPETIDALRQRFSKYEGTHNFHNFTVGKDYNDKTTLRYMKQLEVDDPAVYGDTEWISVRFHGQSFMLHQIRKMVSAALLATRTGSPPSLIDALYGPDRVLIPKAPALGLLLERPVFDTYNRRVRAANEGLLDGHENYRAPVDFDVHKEKIQRFKEQFIYEEMRRKESEVALFDGWIRHIDNYIGEDLAYLNPTGVIPPSAIYQHGKGRQGRYTEPPKGTFETSEPGAESDEEMDKHVLKAGDPE